jgi:Flp pilus assembly pilin Flp
LRRLRRDEAGQVAGIEAIPFGLLVFVVAVLLVTNAWAVIDAKMTVASAAREATRAYVEAPADGDPSALARDAAGEAVRGGGRDPGRLTLTAESEGFTRCQRVTFAASYPVPAITLPWIGGFGHGFTATARHSEIVDPLRSGVPLAAQACESVAP